MRSGARCGGQAAGFGSGRGVGCLGGLWGLGAWAGELVGVGRVLSRIFKVRDVGVWGLGFGG